jgi:hypothetical protein
MALQVTPLTAGNCCKEMCQQMAHKTAQSQHMVLIPPVLLIQRGLLTATTQLDLKQSRKLLIRYHHLSHHRQLKPPVQTPTAAI